MNNYKTQIKAIHDNSNQPEHHTQTMLQGSSLMVYLGWGEGYIEEKLQSVQVLSWLAEYTAHLNMWPELTQAASVSSA
jgi:hypothetical protein